MIHDDYDYVASKPTYQFEKNHKMLAYNCTLFENLRTQNRIRRRPITLSEKWVVYTA